MSNLTTTKKIALLKPGGRLTVCKISPCGSLVARKNSANAVMFFWRYSFGSDDQLISIGVYDATAHIKSTARSDRGFSVSAAAYEAGKHARIHFDNKEDGGYKKIIQVKESEKAEKKNEAAQLHQMSLEVLLLEYCEYLKKLGRTSHTDAKNLFVKNVFNAFPKISKLAARDVTSEQLADIFRKVHERGRARTSNKLRSYVRSAYQIAKSAKTKASIPSGFKKFNITTNPASDTEPDTSANRADKNPLMPDEMLVYWNCIKDLSGLKGGVLRLHLLTGGLRIQQFVRLLNRDVDENSITLIDIKGRPGSSPRPYTTPLCSLAKIAIKQCEPVGTYAISTIKDGNVHLTADTFSKWAREAVGDKISNFQAKRIRSGVETTLAKLKYSKDLRGRLQSHGISGVQDRHYDGHDYLDEKLDMLNSLEKFLTQPQNS